MHGTASPCPASRRRSRQNVETGIATGKHGPRRGQSLLVSFLLPTGIGTETPIGTGFYLRSRPNQSGMAGLYRIWYRQRAMPIPAAPITVPGCPPLNCLSIALPSCTHLLTEICRQTSDCIDDQPFVLNGRQPGWHSRFRAERCAAFAVVVSSGCQAVCLRGMQFEIRQTSCQICRTSGYRVGESNYSNVPPFEYGNCSTADKR